jgi:hypothetical protein
MNHFFELFRLQHNGFRTKADNPAIDLIQTSDSEGAFRALSASPVTFWLSCQTFSATHRAQPGKIPIFTT